MCSILFSSAEIPLDIIIGPVLNIEILRKSRYSGMYYFDYFILTSLRTVPMWNALAIIIYIRNTRTVRIESFFFFIFSVLSISLAVQQNIVFNADIKKKTKKNTENSCCIFYNVHENRKQKNVYIFYDPRAFWTANRLAAVRFRGPHKNNTERTGGGKNETKTKKNRLDLS